MNSDKNIFTYKKNLSYSHFITPGIGALCIYLSFTNEGGIAYRGNLILPYPVSSYFFGLVGILMLLPLIFTLLKARKKQSIILSENKFIYTKGLLKQKQIEVPYSTIKEITYEDDDDDGSSIVIEASRLFDHTFYANNFESKIAFTTFCGEIEELSKA